MSALTWGSELLINLKLGQKMVDKCLKRKLRISLKILFNHKYPLVFCVSILSVSFAGTYNFATSRPRDPSQHLLSQSYQ